MTKTVTLSGGNFGGASVQWPDGASIVSVNDGAGTFWNYDITLHTDAAERADFCGCSNVAQGTEITA